VVIERIAQYRKQLKEDFSLLEILDYHRSFDECVEILMETLKKAVAAIEAQNGPGPSGLGGRDELDPRLFIGRHSHHGDS
jgi:hypothetical protein